MIDFTLTDEHRLLEQSVREWAAREIAPHIRENDRQHRFDRERVLGGMAKLGLLGVAVPAEYGGAGMDYISLGLVSEELEYVDTSLRVIMSVHAGLQRPHAADVGHRGSEAAVSRAAGAGAQDRRLRPDRAVGGQRRARHPDDGGLLADEVCDARSCCSQSTTCMPRPAASRAMPAPLMPPPTTSTSQRGRERSLNDKSARRRSASSHAASSAARAPQGRRAWRPDHPPIRAAIRCR